MRAKSVILTLVGLIILGLAGGFVYFKFFQPEGSDLTQTSDTVAPQFTPLASPGPGASGAPAATPGSGALDFTVDDKGLSKSTAVIQTQYGNIKFKFYSSDAPNTSKRIAELIQQGFYNGLTFHRVVPDFVVQGGDPLGNGTGGSGQKLKAEFNSRKHQEGTVAMARGGDPDSADSQFYISFGPQIHLDNNYTVFGQVIEGMDAVRKIQVGDRMMSVRIE